MATTLVQRIKGAVVQGERLFPTQAIPQIPQERDIARVNSALLPIFVVGLAAVMCKGYASGSTCALLIWAVASLCAGGTLGFLFGIPKSNSAPSRGKTSETADGHPATASPGSNDPRNDARPNTNLEEISDWVTKIIVGLALVNLGEIEKHVQSISKNAAASFSSVPTPGDASFATALLAAFAVLGFFAGYLYTRLFLQGAFARSDVDLKRDWAAVVNQELKKQEVVKNDDPAPSALPTVEQIQSAERVRQATPPGSPGIVMGLVRDVAAEYEAVRDNMPPGRPRTTAMTAVVQKMSTLALSAAPFLSELAASDSAGKRLVAIVILKFKFDLAYLEWLVKRLTAETAFVAYHAASALLGAARSLVSEDKARLKDQVRQAEQDLHDKRLDDQGVQLLIQQILET